MSLTPEQLVALKSYILADPTLNALPATNGGALQIATAMNAVTNPAFVLWKTSVTTTEIMAGAGWDWARVDNLTVGKARIWDWLSRLGFLDASKANIRAGIDAAWVGTAADLAVRTYVYTQCKRTANLVEKVLATGTGSTAVPAIAGYEGVVSYIDIVQAMEW